MTGPSVVRAMLLFMAAVVTAVAGIFALQRRSRPGGLPLSLAMLVIAEWCFASALEASVSETVMKVFWSKVSYIGVTTTSVFFFWFSLEYSRQERLQSVKSILPLFLIPLITTGLAWTNEMHWLIWTYYSRSPVPEYNLLVYGHGLVFWLYVAYAYVLTLASTFRVLQAALRFRNVYRHQMVILVFSVLPPWLVNLFYIFEINRVAGLDLTPAGFAASGLLLSWSFYRFQFLDLLPLARDVVVEEMREGVLVLDWEDRIVDINPEATQLTHLSRSQVIGKSAVEILGGWSELDRSFWDLPDSQKEIFIEGTGYVDWRSSLIQPFPGGLSGRLILLRDVTQLRLATRALETLNAKLEEQVVDRMAEIRTEKEISDAILTSVSDGILMADKDMRIVYANPAFTYLTGFPASDTLGHDTCSLGLCTDRDRLQGFINLVRSQNMSWQGEVTILRKDARKVDAALTISPVRGGDGFPTGYVFTLRDISERKNLDKARHRFMDNVSHQFRTPLTTLKLFAHLLGKSDLTADGERFLQMINGQIDRMASLVQDVVEMAILDSGDAGARWNPVRISDLLQFAIARFEKEIDVAGISFYADSVPSLPTIMGDADRLCQVLTKVLENAIAFTPAGGEVRLSAVVRIESGREWVVISVIDTGPGILPEEQDRVFDRFFRGSLAESGHLPGTGLGLSIAQEIVRAHGGRLTLESDQGGSSFFIWLPVTR